MMHLGFYLGIEDGQVQVIFVSSNVVIIVPTFHASQRRVLLHP